MAAPVSNLLLESLPSGYRERLCAQMEAIALPAETALYEPEETPEYAHFMTSGMASIVAFMSDGVGAEVGIVDREGLVEGLHLLGPAFVPTRGFMQIEGTALRMRFADLRKEFAAAEALRKLVLGFVQCQTTTLGQMAACNRLHEVEERLARWLLMVSDRVGDDVLSLTQEFLAQMLGTRRSSVTLAARSLQDEGLIEYHRGRVRIADRAGLENAACECYPVTRRLLTRLYQ